MPLLWLSTAFVGGIVLGQSLSLPSAAWFALSLVSLLPVMVSLIDRRRGRVDRLSSLQQRLLQWLPFLSRITLPRLPLPSGVLLAAFFLGAARMQVAVPGYIPGALSAYNDRPETFVIEGVLVEPLEIRDNQVYLRVRAERLHPRGRVRFVRTEGLLQARLPAPLDLQYGDRLRLEGNLETPPEFEGFSYRDYLMRQGVNSLLTSASVQRIGLGEGSRMQSWIWALRARALDVIYQIFPDPEAGLLAGILLGVEGGIPEDLMEAFRITGTAHIIAISGFNMSVISGLIVVLFGKLLGKRWGALAAILVIGLYTLLVGAQAGVVRAAIMAGMGMFAVLLGRRQSGVNTLAFVAALMALWTPYVLWDVGFQFSFFTTLGLVLFAEPLSEAFRAFASRRLPENVVQRITGPVGEYLLYTLAAQLMVLPLMIYYFGSVSLISLLANPLVLPVQPALLTLSGLAVLVGLAFQPLGQALAYLAWPFSAYTIRVVELLAQVPYAAYATGPVWVGWVIIFYLALFTLIMVKDRTQVLGKIWKPSLLLVVLGTLALGAWRVALSAPDGLLHMTILDTNTNGRSGDAVLIRTPSGSHVLVDGGPSPNALSTALGRRLPLGRRGIDWLLVAGTGEGQLGGLPGVLERFDFQNILWSGSPLGSASSRYFLQEAGRLGIPVHQAKTGQRLDLGNGASIEVLAVTSRGMVLLVEWKNFRALLPVGLDFEMMESLHPGAMTVLLMPESGYAPLNTPEWLASLQPQLALLSVAAGDRDGLPDPEALQAAAGYNLLRTDEHGWIEITTDGKQMWVEAAR
jgi:competence protein ComEC